MILIADSGSTKVDWAYFTPNGEVGRLKTMGINPAHVSDEAIVAVLSGEILPVVPKVDSIHFFGAGVVGEQMCTRLRDCFNAVWPDAKVEILSDVLASGLALFGKEQGISCILGTGSNSCLYEDGKILSSVKAGGFILGDEGSGVWIGKELLSDYIKGIMPEPLLEKMEDEYKLTYPEIVSRVYREDRPAAYLAEFCLFAARNSADPYIESLVKRGFKDFLVRNVMRYEGFSDKQVGFVGSVAFKFQEWLLDLCAAENIRVKKIMKAPIDALIEYYKTQGE